MTGLAKYRKCGVLIEKPSLAYPHSYDMITIPSFWSYYYLRNCFHNFELNILIRASICGKNLRNSFIYWLATLIKTEKFVLSIHFTEKRYFIQFYFLRLSKVLTAVCLLDHLADVGNDRRLRTVSYSRITSKILCTMLVNPKLSTNALNVCP